ncbi:hypothetical protein HOR19_gp13 [Phage MedPE-SWcel-C56]|uniref:Uncharacterized protein n=1 Tax=Phage MedPE-SWcel-C56 TaxID=1871314 RepID=A0A1B1IY05_9CAUD|nr:hypothetical protein HOR19_gp13 [Phage MedPE-SWcel-C56]ANS06206.1 hypothetical protein [Phage MedPE-SWcel-C56]
MTGFKVTVQEAQAARSATVASVFVDFTCGRREYRCVVNEKGVKLFKWFSSTRGSSRTPDRWSPTSIVPIPLDVIKAGMKAYKKLMRAKA